MLSAGSRLGPYEIVAPLGAGGMGEVYRAKDTRLGRDVAVKVLPAEVASDPERLQRFDLEARAASALNHPNILVVHDIGSERGTSYLVTELLTGESLRERLARGPLQADRATELAVQIARGLSAAHERGIVHRDLKPENLFVTRDGTIKILDFGLARIDHPELSDTDFAEASTRLETRDGTVLGTVGYMAPEQVRGERADTRSDLFAFGCVLYEMLAGARAFARPSAVETMNAILHDEPPPVPASRPLSPTLDHLVAHCLEKDPGRRFQSARDLVYALEEARSSMVGGMPAAAQGGPKRPRSRLRALALGAAASVVVLAFFVGLSYRHKLAVDSASTAIDSLAVLPLANLSGDPRQEYFADGMTEALIAELAKLKALKVISRTSVMRFKGTERPLPEIARELGVHGIVEGSVLHDGEKVRITVQLVDAPEDRHLWAESYTRPARDVLRLQGEVARSIARQVQIAVSPSEEQALAATRQVDPEAHRLLLQATELSRRGGTRLENQRQIAELVDQALELAPEYAEAHALRASNLYTVAGTGYRAGSEICPASRVEVQRALELDPSSISARITAAWIRSTCEYDWRGAESDFGDLLDLAPGDAAVHDSYALLLSMIGRHREALEHARRAFELDPLNEWIGGHRLMELTAARRLPEAERFAKTLLALFPESIFVHWVYGGTQMARGDLDGALATYLARSVERPEMNPMVGLVQGLAGREQEARRVLDFLLTRRRERYVPASMIAMIYGGLGERNQAFEWLDRAYEDRDYFLAGALVEPRFDSLREDSRFDTLLARMNLSPAI